MFGPLDLIIVIFGPCSIQNRTANWMVIIRYSYCFSDLMGETHDIVYKFKSHYIRLNLNS